MKDWGRIGRRREPHTVRVVCDQCAQPMAAPAPGDPCPLCDVGTLIAMTVDPTPGDDMEAWLGVEPATFEPVQLSLVRPS